MGEYVNTNNENIRNWLRDAITLTEPSPQNESMSEEYDSIFADEETMPPMDDYYEPLPPSFNPRLHYGRLNYFGGRSSNLHYLRNVPYSGFYPRNYRYLRSRSNHPLTRSASLDVPRHNTDTGPDNDATNYEREMISLVNRTPDSNPSIPHSTSEGYRRASDTQAPRHSSGPSSSSTTPSGGGSSEAIPQATVVVKTEQPNALSNSTTHAVVTSTEYPSTSSASSRRDNNSTSSSLKRKHSGISESVDKRVKEEPSDAGSTRATCHSSISGDSEMVAGPSGISINNSDATTMTERVYPDSSSSDDETPANLSSQRSNPLSAPDLQLDCFSDTSSEYGGNNGEEASQHDDNNRDEANAARNSSSRNSEPPARRGSASILNTPRMMQNMNNNAEGNMNRRGFSAYQRSSYDNNDNRAFSNNDFGRNFQNYNANQNNSGPNFSPSPAHSGSNFIPNRSGFNRLTNRSGEHSHYMRSHPRRFHFPNNRQMPYLPHQWLYNRQQVMQEIYRRHMINDFGDILYDSRYYLPYIRSRENYNGFGIGERPQVGSYYYPRRSYPYVPQYYRPLDRIRLPEEDNPLPSYRRYLQRGASLETIESNTFSYKFQPLKRVPDEEYEKCSICLTYYEVDCYVRRLGCLHAFHRDCVDKWLVLNQSCPICRIDIQKARVPVAT